jgi:uncharacterized protein YidB (DUF937 family)
VRHVHGAGALKCAPQAVAGLGPRRPRRGCGLSGLVEKFTSAGLGQQAASWVSTGQNMPISADQLLSALGRDNVQSASQKLGIPGATALGGLAALLPTLIDQLTPKGQIEQDGDLSAALSALRGKLGV